MTPIRHTTPWAAALRQFIRDQGGTIPEDLPTPTDSIQQIQARRRKLLEAEEAARQAGVQQDALFGEPDE